MNIHWQHTGMAQMDWNKNGLGHEGLLLNGAKIQRSKDQNMTGWACSRAFSFHFLILKEVQVKLIVNFYSFTIINILGSLINNCLC